MVAPCHWRDDEGGGGDDEQRHPVVVRRMPARRGDESDRDHHDCCEQPHRRRLGPADTESFDRASQRLIRCVGEVPDAPRVEHEDRPVVPRIRGPDGEGQRGRGDERRRRGDDRARLAPDREEDDERGRRELYGGCEPDTGAPRQSRQPPEAIGDNERGEEHVDLSECELLADRLAHDACDERTDDEPRAASRRRVSADLGISDEPPTRPQQQRDRSGEDDRSRHRERYCRQRHENNSGERRVREQQGMRRATGGKCDAVRGETVHDRRTRGAIHEKVDGVVLAQQHHRCRQAANTQNQPSPHGLHLRGRRRCCLVASCRVTADYLAAASQGDPPDCSRSAWFFRRQRVRTTGVGRTGGCRLVDCASTVHTCLLGSSGRSEALGVVVRSWTTMVR